ncbi:MAG: glutamine--fructose-6-phosphate transaminase (isomerizing) [Gammaproteobacteria bacterium]|nr:glutamine--fructose-6-phosphate transaminase (isomerizing) [Gammaproteobacteria bacterium]
MCGIVGAVAQRDVVPILIEGLRRLEYRGYDSAGVSVISAEGELERRRAAGKIASLSKRIEDAPIRGHIGIAHTRWATHGEPTEDNAHPHVSRDNVAVVHNGIIENHEALRGELTQRGYVFTSQTDSEVIAHMIEDFCDQGADLLEAVQRAVSVLDGAYALGVIRKGQSDRLIAARRGSPLLIGVGVGEHFIASDVMALIPVTQQFIFLEDGDTAELTRTGVRIFDVHGNAVERPIQTSGIQGDVADRSGYRHYMLKEIFEQPAAVSETLEGRIHNGRVLESAFGYRVADIFDKIERVVVVACGTSYHAGLTARYWFEGIAGVPCTVEVASEFRYRKTVQLPGTLIVTISQSGETADTLAALKETQRLGMGHSLAICNVPESSLVRASDLVLMTHAGPEIGVASTKAFTTQLVALLLLAIVLGRRHGMNEETEASIVRDLTTLPGAIENTLKLNGTIEKLSEQFADKHHALFLGRGSQYPVAMEGALKLKEISYIHAEAYPAGELKHGPLALVDAEMPVIAVAPNNELLEKLKSNLQEVRARGGKLIVFADAKANVNPSDDVQVISVPQVSDTIAPIVYTIPLQLLAYHAAILKGTDVDQPRNLAKSVTVE